MNTSASWTKTIKASSKPLGIIKINAIAAVIKAVQAGISNFPILLKITAKLTNSKRIMGKIKSRKRFIDVGDSERNLNFKMDEEKKSEQIET